MRRTIVVVVVAIVSVACGGDDDRADSAGSCLDAIPDDAGVVDVTVAPPLSPSDQERGQALLARFNASQDRVRVDVEDPGWPPERRYAQLYDGEGADIVPVFNRSLPSLVHADVVAPPPPCLTDELEASTTVARSMSSVDGESWGVALGVQALFLLYEREAFTSAGLDPDAPPSTVAELLEVARKLQAAGFDRPLVTPFTGHPLIAAPVYDHERQEFQLDGDAGVILDLLRTMASEGLLSSEPPEGTPEGVPAIGTDEVVMEIGDLGLVWGIGTGLADGQAPGVSIAVAPVPGIRQPEVPGFGDVLTVSAAASDHERSAAWAFVEWLASPEQQSEIHLLADLLPSRADATTTRAVEEYWDEIPLLGEAWARLTEHGRSGRGTRHPTSVYSGSIEAAVDDVLFAGADPAARFAAAEDQIENRRAAFERDARGFLACIVEEDADACDRLGLEQPEPHGD